MNNNFNKKIVVKYIGNKPIYASSQAAGADLLASNKETIVLKPMQRVLVETGLYLELPVGYEAQIRSRSGQALKNGIMVLNSPGTIDSDYRGEVGVILMNLGHEDFMIEPNSRIAQLVISPVLSVDFVETDKLSGSTRGDGGFGSTGK